MDAGGAARGSRTGAGGRLGLRGEIETRELIVERTQHACELRHVFGVVAFEMAEEVHACCARHAAVVARGDEGIEQCAKHGERAAADRPIASDELCHV